METVIETIGLTKRYGALAAVDGVSLGVKKGEIYGFLGLNGAGKTTTIRMLLGMIRPSAGTAVVLGERIVPGKQGPWEKLGYLVETPYAYPELTVRENLQAVARLRGLAGEGQVRAILERLHLGEYGQVRARNLSLGNAQRLGLAKALIHSPEILILDEPSNGLDPAGIVEIRELLTSLSREAGTTVFVSSHNLGEISRITTRIGIIHRGTLIREMAREELDRVLSKTLLLDCRDREAAATFLEGKGWTVERTRDGLISLPSPAACEKPEEINTTLVEAGHPPLFLKTDQEDLESYFLRMIGEDRHE
jgi:ABC-2 type transport system ATP-binding protein